MRKKMQGHKEVTKVVKTKMRKGTTNPDSLIIGIQIMKPRDHISMMCSNYGNMGIRLMIPGTHPQPHELERHKDIRIPRGCT